MIKFLTRNRAALGVALSFSSVLLAASTSACPLCSGKVHTPAQSPPRSETNWLLQDLQVEFITVKLIEVSEEKGIPVASFEVGTHTLSRKKGELLLGALITEVRIEDVLTAQVRLRTPQRHIRLVPGKSASLKSVTLTLQAPKQEKPIRASVAEGHFEFDGNTYVLARLSPKGAQFRLNAEGADLITAAPSGRRVEAFLQRYLRQHQLSAARMIEE